MLYIANTTQQTFRFMHRGPEMVRDLVLDIPSGMQHVCGENWNKQQLESAINHLERFGGRSVTDSRIKPDEFDGLMYSVDKPISSDRIHDANEVFKIKQQQRAVNEATKSALAFDVATREGKKANGKRLAKVSEVEVVQDIPAREKPTGNEVQFKVTVDPSINNQV